MWGGGAVLVELEDTVEHGCGESCELRVVGN